MKSYSTYYLEKGDEVPCMRCGNKFILEYEPIKCCRSKQASAFNMCGCQGALEPIFCDKCWELIKNET